MAKSYGEKGSRSVSKLHEFLKASKLLVTQRNLLNYCTHCKTVLVSSDTSRGELNCENRYTLNFKTEQNETIATNVFFPEYTIGAVAIAVSPKGKYAELKDKFVVNPANNKKMPVISVESINTEAEFITPLHSPEDERIAREFNIESSTELFDDNGNISLKGYEGLNREEARKAVLEKFGENKTIEKGNWKADVLRCGRCESLLINKYSDQLFVKIDEAKELLTKAIENNEVIFSHPNWKKMVLKYLEKSDSWCISRQYWWGNNIPSEKEYEQDVFSTWFSLTAMALEGAGWNENPRTETIDEVFVNKDFLLRWVVPSLLISLLITGKPVFKNIQCTWFTTYCRKIFKKN
jgi:valyl-tRNA synthetase